MRLPASIACTWPLCTSMESPAATETLLTHFSAVPLATAFANFARVTPFLRPTKSEAPGAEWATYQFSVFGSPPRDDATDAGGWTCRLSLSEQSSHLTRSGKRASGFHAGPMMSAEWWPISSRSVVPPKRPPLTRDSASGLSTISQLSPMGGPGGSSRPRSVWSLRPPHTRSW
jgi:hypothetical protein